MKNRSAIIDKERAIRLYLSCNEMHAFDSGCGLRCYGQREWREV